MEYRTAFFKITLSVNPRQFRQNWEKLNRDEVDYHSQDYSYDQTCFETHFTLLKAFCSLDLFPSRPVIHEPVVDQHKVNEPNGGDHGKLLRMGKPFLSSERQMADVVIDPVDQHSSKESNEGADKPVDGRAEFCGPIAAVECEEQGRNQKEDHGFSHMQPSPIGGKEPSCATDRRTPPQLLGEVKEEEETEGNGYDSKESSKPS